MHFALLVLKIPSPFDHNRAPQVISGFLESSAASAVCYPSRPREGSSPWKHLSIQPLPGHLFC